jgi:hypothetical protein
MPSDRRVFIRSLQVINVHAQPQQQHNTQLPKLLLLMHDDQRRHASQSIQSNDYQIRSSYQV